MVLKVKMATADSSEEDQMAAFDEEQPEYRMDSGLQAWLQVLGSWILFANTWLVA